MNIGIICKNKSEDILPDLIGWLKGKGSEVYMEEDFAENLPVKGCAPHEMASFVEMVVVLGGDGTMLRAARLMAEKDVSLVGVNLGGLGFITEVSKEDLYDTLEKVLKGDYRKEKRIMLHAQVIRGGKKTADFTALNDIVISKGTLARLIDLQTIVDDTHVNLFKADGIIVATPTGSTAYSLSAGGPILHPSLRGIIITPICPHTLTNRPIVLSDEVKIEIALRSESEGVYLTYDGQEGFSIEKDDVVSIEKSFFATKLIVPKKSNHFKVLREKLKWGER
jgi:NAD+ kinase